MKKWILPVVVAILLAALVFCLIGYGLYWAFFDIQRIEGQEELTVSNSPTMAYTLTIYRNNGGGTAGYALLGTVKDNLSGETWNIYWDGDHQEAEIRWLDNQTVSINGIELDVLEDTYDYRRATGAV